MHEEYRELIKGKYADLDNAPEGRKAGTIVGGMFLSEFVGDVPWAHLDIAGSAWELNRPYVGKRGLRLRRPPARRARALLLRLSRRPRSRRLTTAAHAAPRGSTWARWRPLAARDLDQLDGGAGGARPPAHSCG